ncbi:protein GrpE [Clostridium acetireducens DSM 10703]|jgi:molecular chaperone GrpE|uniref:Protein GrpE n=1 Tax=Clostridium acetireducens DSM 10703 TaxID=1121290 RepID=A0A1E8F146_9CLOT|nr:nucleotide exchange factor GrpE [Clostridium acetireducens]OFI07193.1 protein GrpE [Clostridium acetireducens DSM 10703]
MEKKVEDLCTDKKNNNEKENKKDNLNDSNKNSEEAKNTQEENKKEFSKKCNNEENKKQVKLEDVLEELKGANSVLADENEKLENQITALKDRIERTVAEYDNYRKRTSKEKEGIYLEACGDVLKELLPVLDNLERAVQADGDVDSIRKGIEMTISQFKNSLNKLGVEEISTENGFDPKYHEAMMHVENDKYDKNQIVEVFIKGYKKGDKVLRYSSVKVAN